MHPRAVIATTAALLALGAAAVPSAQAAQPAARHPRAAADTGTDLAVRGEGFPQYRIPALTTSRKGTLIAAYDARPSMADLPSHIALVVRRSTDGGATWQPRTIARRAPAPQGYGDPSLLTDRTTGRIFLFHAAGVNQGFAGSHTGNDENDPDILQADYSYSDDDGATWTSRRITKMIKDPSWGGMFAASGQGIQLRHGPHRGRLLQQYVIRKDGANYAASAYSDDHGATWHMGHLIGPGADENKTVELADGTVLLNNRAAPYRTVARSTDGGVTYSPLTADPQLPDPGNNGSIIRWAPDAPPGDPASHVLLFSNTADTAERRNLTVRLSCDDGRTWSASKAIDPGAAGYSTMTRLPNGRIGLFYERGDYQYLTYRSFALGDIGTCAAH